MAEALKYSAGFQTLRMEVKDTGRLQLLGKPGEQAFEQVFKSNFKSLHAYAFTIIKDDIVAEEIVQNVFCRLWEKKSKLDIQTSLAAYLYRSVYHETTLLSYQDLLRQCIRLLQIGFAALKVSHLFDW